MAACRTLTDTDLLALVKQGDQAAFTQIYERYSSLLYAYAYKLTAGTDAARDLLQEVFTALWDNRETTQINTSLNAYLYTAIRFQFLKTIAHQKIKTAYAERFVAEMEEGEDLQELAATEAELVARVEALLAQLSPKMARVLRMSRLEQVSNADIADEMGLSEKTVKNLKTQAIKSLRMKIGLLTVLVYLAGR